MRKTAFSERTAVVVDDEPLPRTHLAYLLKEAGIGQVFQAADAASCLELFDREDDPPDWAFLDVQMPGMDGLALADALGAGQLGLKDTAAPPSIVFVTGYEEYAVQAFERAAVDYLLKPVQRTRLAVTLERLNAGLVNKAGQAAGPAAIGTSLLAPVLQRLPIRTDYAVRLVDIAEIVAATAHDKRVDIITRDMVYPTYYTLSQLELRLPQERFVRVHDGWIVSLADILEIHNLGAQTYQLRLRFENRLVPISRRRLPALQQRLGL